MTYEEARNFIDQSNQYGSKLGLEAVTELLSRLGNPQEQVKVIHVAGTNGKGSTTAYIASILAMEGYKIGRYISPAVFSYRERIQLTCSKAGTDEKEQKEIHLLKSCLTEDSFADINCTENSTVLKVADTEFISRQGVIDAIGRIKPACEAMVKEGFSHPTTFEIETAMAFLYFAWQQVDFAVVEVGLGGRLDATNVVTKPVCCVIASISMDHMQYLGNSLAEIAREKAGIIKNAVPVVTCRQEPEVLPVLKEACREKDAVLLVADAREAEVLTFLPEGTVFHYGNRRYGIKLLGRHQVTNAVLALCTAEVLRQQGYQISDRALDQGLLVTRWRGRLEVIARKPYFLIDGAHNEDAAEKLAEAVREYFPGRRIIMVVGVFADKDYCGILKRTAPLASLIITLTPNNSRALASEQLALEAQKCCPAVIDANTAEQAVREAYKEAAGEDVIIAFGSLSFLGELREWVTCSQQPDSEVQRY
jgi:dihydrofolate synthase/folylpolyglutamate synthase